MSYFPLTAEQEEWKQRAADLALRVLAPRAVSLLR